MLGTMTCSVGHVCPVLRSTMTPSPPSGSLLNVNLSVWLEKLTATHISQFASISRERSPPKRAKGLPVWRCCPFRINGSSSFRQIFRLLNRETRYFINVGPLSKCCCHWVPGRMLLANLRALEHRIIEHLQDLPVA